MGRAYGNGDSRGAAMDIVQRTMNCTMAKYPLVLDDGPVRAGRKEEAWPDLCDARHRMRRGANSPAARDARADAGTIGPARRMG